MGNKIIQQEDIDILLQSNKTLYYKLELLNENLMVIDCIEGNLISDNINISAESDVRRTYNCELLVTDSTFTINNNGKLWFDKRIRPYIGVLNTRTNKIQYYLLGTYFYKDVGFNYDVVTNKLSLTCNDCMCLLNDIRGGQLDAYSRIIPVNSSVRSVIISLLQEVNITVYSISFNINNVICSDFKIPHDMTYNAGTTAYQIINEIINLYPGNQMYFDIYGNFIIDKISTGDNEQNILTDDIIQPLLINENTNISFSQIYNHIIIYGKQQSPDYYSQEVSLIDNIYYTNIVVRRLDEIETVDVLYDAYNNYDVFAIKIPESCYGDCYLNINSLGNIPIVNELGENINGNVFSPNTDYIFRYRKDVDNVNNNFLFIGEYQVTGEAIDTDSDVSVSAIGDKLKVLSGGDYDMIPSSELCEQRAKYELYNAIKFHDSINMSCIAIPWLDVNEKIQFTSNVTKQTNEYLVNSIQCDYSSQQMNITLIRYYPNYI